MSSWSSAIAAGGAWELLHWGRDVVLELAGGTTGYDPGGLEPIDDESEPPQALEIRATLATDEGVRVGVGGGGELSVVDAVWSTLAARITAAGANRQPREGDQVVEYDGTVERARWKVASVDRPADGLWVRLLCQRVQ